MTKQVRIENADMTDKVVIVEVWDKGVDGHPDQMVTTRELAYPTAMVSDLYLTSTRYLVVKEAAA